MITVDEARERAREWAGEDADLGIYEFGAGYVVWVVGPQPTEENPGGRRAVVDKHTGALTRYGSLPARVIADRYGREVAARRRFPDRVLAHLRDAGWFPGRDVGHLVDDWLRDRYDRQPVAERSLPLFPAARAVLVEFGGLRVGDAEFHPHEGSFALDRYAGFADLVGAPVFPVALVGDGVVVVDARGRVFLLHWTGDGVVADTVDTAIAAMVDGLGDKLDDLPPVSDPA